jgi:hypothetical protein
MRLTGKKAGVLGSVALVVLAAVILSSASASAQGVTVALTPPSVQVAPGDTFDLYVTVTQAGSPFNGFDAVLGWDAAALTPVSSNEGQLMTDACATRFYMFHPGADSDTITDVLLCNGVSVTGPGQIYHLRFHASATPQTTQVVFLPTLRFYDAGLFVNPVTSTDATVTITSPVDAGPARLPRRLDLAVAPNPGRGGSIFTIATDRDGSQSLRVFDSRGRLVRTLDDSTIAAGVRTVRWDGKDSQGRPLARGVYYVRVEDEGRSLTKRVTLLW